MGTRLRIAVVVAGGFGIFWGVKETRLASAASDMATTLTCKQLGDSGAASNAHVVLKDFLLTANFVYEEQKERSRGWNQVWVPAVPIDGEYAKKVAEAGGIMTNVPVPRPIHVIITAKNIVNEQDLARLGGREELEGLVVNVVESIDGDTKKMLEKTYGDIGGAQILEVGRKPTSAVLALLVVLASSIGVLWVVRSWFSRKQDAPPPPVSATSPAP